MEIKSVVSFTSIVICPTASVLFCSIDNDAIPLTSTKSGLMIPTDTRVDPKGIIIRSPMVAMACAPVPPPPVIAIEGRVYVPNIPVLGSAYPYPPSITRMDEFVSNILPFTSEPFDSICRVAWLKIGNAFPASTHACSVAWLGKPPKGFTSTGTE